MKRQLIFLIFLLIFSGCLGKSQSFQHPRGLKIINCDKSSLDLMRVEESSSNKTNIKVSAFNYPSLLRYFSVFNDDPRAKIVTSIRRKGGVELDIFKKETTQLVLKRKKSFFAIHTPSGEIDALDPRIFLDKGDYILTASRGCKNETSIVFDNKMTTKYIYTFGLELIILNSDAEGGIESTIDFDYESEDDNSQYFSIDRKVTWNNLTEEMTPFNIEVGWNGFSSTAQRPPYPKLKLSRDQTFTLEHKGSTYNFFELKNTAYHFHGAKTEAQASTKDMPKGYLIDNRRGIAFSFLENQIEREKNELDTNL